ncbi:MAG TPA: prolyl oligopeptidase family serine peptidase [Actinoplanes sp.]|jgi:dienelactone hydrolase
MAKRRRIGAALAMLLALAACSGPPQPLPPPAERPAATTPTAFPVGLRILHLNRGSVRPLPTLVFYPAQPWTLAGAGSPVEQPAAGRFPLVVFSHGLKGSPERYQAALSGWAAAGFVVVAPNFPHTSQYATDFRRSDIVRQPNDVRYVLAEMRRLDATPGDPLAGHIDTTRIAAIGHSAGGYTTMGLFTAGHDPSLKAGVIMAGWLAPGAFAGPPATMLFLQGTADPIVPAARSRVAFDRVPWPKAYLLLRHNSHATYLQPGQTGYDLMESTVIDFLRWTLDGDQAARARLPRGTTAR